MPYQGALDEVHGVVKQGKESRIFYGIGQTRAIDQLEGECSGEYDATDDGLARSVTPGVEADGGGEPDEVTADASIADEVEVEVGVETKALDADGPPETAPSLDGTSLELEEGFLLSLRELVGEKASSISNDGASSESSHISIATPQPGPCLHEKSVSTAVAVKVNRF